MQRFARPLAGRSPLRYSILILALALAIAAPDSKAGGRADRLASEPSPVRFALAATTGSASKPGQFIIEAAEQPAGAAVGISEVSALIEPGAEFDFSAAPSCGRRMLRRQVVPARCAAAVLGGGQAEVETYEAGAPVTETEPARIYHSGFSSGSEKLSVRFELRAPAVEVVLMPLRLQRNGERPYGTQLTLRVPQIEGGRGAVLRLRTMLGGPFRCQRGEVLQASAEATLRSGEESTEELGAKCQ